MLNNKIHLGIDYVEIKSSDQLVGWLTSLRENMPGDKRFDLSRIGDNQVLLDSVELECFNGRGLLRKSKMIYYNDDTVFVESGSLEDDEYSIEEFLEVHQRFGPRFVMVNDNYLRAQALVVASESRRLLGVDAAKSMDVTFVSVWDGERTIETQAVLDVEGAEIVSVSECDNPDDYDALGHLLYEYVRLNDGSNREFRVIQDAKDGGHFLALESVVSNGVLDFSAYEEDCLTLDVQTETLTNIEPE